MPSLVVNFDKTAWEAAGKSKRKKPFMSNQSSTQNFKHYEDDNDDHTTMTTTLLLLMMLFMIAKTLLTLTTMVSKSYGHRCRHCSA